MSSSSDVNSQNVLQFSPLQSFVNPTFWHKLAELKIDFDRLSDAPKSIYGYYTNRNTKACLLEVEYSAFNSEFKAPKFCYPAVGTLYNKNTIEDFKECDKSELLQKEGRKLLADFKNGKVLDDPSYLSRFFILSFADLKCHNYYYWFAFPCPLTPTLGVIGEPSIFKNISEIQHFTSVIKSMPIESQNYFVIKSNKSTTVHTLKEVIREIESKDIEIVDYYFCFANNNEFQHPSWHMRTYAAFIFHQCLQLIGKEVKFLGLRYDNQMEIENSLIWTVVQKEPIDFSNDETVQFVGWEPNRNNKMGPRMVSMKDSMDPTKLAE
ncbi:ubiquitin-like modifier-activating enzyme ATG7, partial [Teleopsis dalmanni]|uniref:ubiquitin-like modifier-activating enzyme ATG7 n=1 Tax=Teleopsis dalmanni TaxID=139649 RepID=UPI0018CDAD9D